MENLKRKKRTRNGHRSYVKKTITEINELLANEGSDRTLMQGRKAALEEQLEMIQALDSEILKLLEEISDLGDDAVSNEIEEAASLRADVKATIWLIDERSKGQSSASVVDGNERHSVRLSAVRVKLPKLEIRKFDGRVERWQEFWDSFSSSVDNNPDLSDVDKFSYLRGLLKDKARDSISGYALTSANYRCAKEQLQQRYGRRNIIERTHIRELLSLPAVYSERDPARLRAFYDAIETHHRGLQALNVEQDKYATIVVPSLMDKLPETVRLSLLRGKRHEEWNVDDLLNELVLEVELREEHTKAKPQRLDSTNKEDLRSAAALTTRTVDERCAFCLEGHLHENCGKVININDRKAIVRKYGRCFICLGKGHKARDCRKRVNCNACKRGGHHTSLCDLGKRELPNLSAVASPSMHVNSGCRVVLQTAQGVLKGAQNQVRIRVMFDTGSHKSFVTSKAVRAAKLLVKRKEWLEITTFAKTTCDSKLREVFELEISPFKGHGSIKMEAYAVESIAQVKNEHVELRKRDYAHLRNLWFSDVCRANDVFDVDVLIGSDYLWLFQNGNTVRGRPNEPVAVERSLGWVLSGQVKAPSEGINWLHSQVSCVNLVGHDPGTQVTDDIHRLWDYDSVGIRENNEVHEALKDGIVFTGERYQVKLPWKEAHEPLPSNYNVSVKRLKGQLTKLRQQPDILQEYDHIIKEQLQSGIIEPVVELERSEKIHYLPHHAVVRKEAKTTKVRVVYDASCKESKNSLSLNDCLHVGPPLTPLLFDILLRFREKRVALTADIEKAFLNVEIAKDDRDTLRFLWVNDVTSSTLKPVAFRFCRVVFGVNCSPFLLNATLRYHFDKYAESDEKLIRKLKNSFYVDDLVAGGQTDETTIELYQKSKNLLSDGGFKLRKWLSNSPKVREAFHKGEGKHIVSNSKLELDENSFAKSTISSNDETRLEKVLGLPWNFETDTFHFEIGRISTKAFGKRPTRRNILSILAALYDPLGIISPISVMIKVLIQDLCKEGLDWDDDISGEMRNLWHAWLRDLHIAKQIVINRCIYGTIDKPAKCTLHGFSDASVKAYCAVIFFVCEINGAFHIELLTSKTRVAPIKAQTIPRLELMAALILARLESTVL